MLTFLILAMSLAQTQPMTKQDIQKYLLRRKEATYACHTGSKKCNDVCNKATDLQEAAEELARCAARHDLTDDCSSQTRDTRDAADAYEDAVTNAEGDCEVD
jgi:hypothetical protein